MGVMGRTVSEVKGHGRQKGHKEIYRRCRKRNGFSGQDKAEILVDAERVNGVVETICTRRVLTRLETARYSSCLFEKLCE